MENIVILGSTGSVGKQVLDVIKRYPKRFKVFGLAAKDEVKEIKKQVKQFKPKLIVVENKEVKKKLKTKNILIGEKGLVELVSNKKVDTVIVSTSGTIAFSSLFAAIKGKKKIIQANKETIIMGGRLVNQELKKYNQQIIPIDSEHSAIFQCLKGENKKHIKNLILTCSGGSFRNHSLSQLKKVTVKQALNHPVWKMGSKITIDSATLMNKGFEVIEAHYLFNIPLEKIKVIIHPEGIIHSMVEFSDNSVKALLAMPDMRGPIQYALFYPERDKQIISSLDFKKINNLSFSLPDLQRFPCLKLAYQSLKKGGTMPSALVIADEIAVQRFLQGKIKFLEIPKLIEKILQKHRFVKNPSLKDILSIEKELILNSRSF